MDHVTIEKQKVSKLKLLTSLTLTVYLIERYAVSKTGLRVDVPESLLAESLLVVVTHQLQLKLKACPYYY